VNNKRVLIIGFGIFLCVGPTLLFFNAVSKKGTSDQALLAIIKNDQKSFQEFIENGGDIHALLPVIDGQSFTVAEGIVHFERTGFLKYLKDQNKSFVKQDATKDYDILSLAIAKNNPEMLGLILSQNPQLDRLYGKEGWSLLHLTSSHCSSKLVSLLHQTGKLDWKTLGKDGTTPLTLAAEKDCLQVLSYWKDAKADFKAKDGKGQSAMNILKGKKDAALSAFADSFKTKTVATADPIFYQKRVFPKDALVDRSELLEPEERPEDANETADYSEFSE
jgi:hypothetical protein